MAEARSTPGRCVGLAVLSLIGVFGIAHLTNLPVFLNTQFREALLGGLMAAGATAVGTVPVLLSRQFSPRVHSTLLGFGAGVMLAASIFSLVLPAISTAKAQGAGPWGAAGIVGAGVLLGGVMLGGLARTVPLGFFTKNLNGPEGRALKRAWLFVLAITLHNVPEGLAIGVGFASPDAVGAHALAAGISIQDVPEGLVVALAMRGVGLGRWSSAGIGALSGLVEPLASIIGVALVGLSAGLLPWGLALAAGAMLFVISHEIIPESHSEGNGAFATSGLMLGFVLMMMADSALS